MTVKLRTVSKPPAKGDKVRGFLVRTKQWLSNANATYAGSLMSSGHGGKSGMDRKAAIHTERLLLDNKMERKAFDVREQLSRSRGRRCAVIWGNL